MTENDNALDEIESPALEKALDAVASMPASAPKLLVGFIIDFETDEKYEEFKKDCGIENNDSESFKKFINDTLNEGEKPLKIQLTTVDLIVNENYKVSLDEEQKASEHDAAVESGEIAEDEAA